MFKQTNLKKYLFEWNWAVQLLQKIVIINITIISFIDSTI